MASWFITFVHVDANTINQEAISYEANWYSVSSALISSMTSSSRDSKYFLTLWDNINIMHRRYWYRLSHILFTLKIYYITLPSKLCCVVLCVQTEQMRSGDHPNCSRVLDSSTNSNIPNGITETSHSICVSFFAIDRLHYLTFQHSQPSNFF